MTSVVSVLAGLGYDLVEDELADVVASLLDERAASPGVELTATEQEFLNQHGGVPRVSARVLADLDLRTAARATSEAARSLTRAEVAARLHRSGPAISHMAARRAIWSYPAHSGRPVYPDWQFERDHVVPHLPHVVAAVPVGTHPITMRTFMTRPDPDLQVYGKPVSPREWLLGGGDPSPVVAAAATLDETV